MSHAYEKEGCLWLSGCGAFSDGVGDVGKLWMVF